jgi:nucleotide-binding universal stress UspA family protein
MYKKIIVGIDDSEDAKNALKKGIELQKKYNSELVAFHSVIHKISEINPTFLSSGAGGQISYQIHEDNIKRGRRIIEEAEKTAKDAGSELETRLIFDILPADYIKKMAKEEEFDLIVLGCQGQHSKLKRTILGTVPDKIINGDVSSDVLLVR